MNKKFVNDFESLIESRHNNNETYERTLFFNNDPHSGERLIIEGYNFIAPHFTNIKFSNIKFINCNFKSSGFNTNIEFGICIFESCKFENIDADNFNFYECDINKTDFIESRFSFSMFSSVLFNDVKFENCNELIELYFIGCNFSGLQFNYSNLYYTRFLGNNFYKNKFLLTFYDSVINNCHFSEFDLSYSEFGECNLDKTTFSNCVLCNKSINHTNSSYNKEFSYIDFQTLLNSKSIDRSVLRKCFGLDESIISEKILNMVEKAEYQTVFISYSFKDKKFANTLNERIKKIGITTFLWEKDAPGGKGLKKIMRENIKNRDRLLFIASENSIRSNACQFELSEGKKKQNLLWNEILFPIHIDNYLFQIEKDEIRPLEKQEEYWSNIIELKEINSIDFSKVMVDLGGEEFDLQISKLIEGLKK